ncbi:hypothetical protein SAMN04487771_10305 [[Clostridium] aminophilum]|uniref:Uncharacterized protein n=1 Tax=[Clostridium] aminophilum TaxID=1526 RepID=A0A1I0G3P0_9FIRM|nr:hypothetical protein [[Clostridium] aminophilum]SET65236.1 hypothetical protein SAMN04487771_10305 [[Clostridium] aminophilum]
MAKKRIQIAHPGEKANFERAKCDKYDYMIAASCGVLAGLVDVFFVGASGQSVLQGTVDKGADELVKMICTQNPGHIY